MSTQVPPSRLDSTKDFSSLVPSAFAQANAAFAAANSASGAAATSTPRISSIVYPGDDTAAATAGGQTVTLNGAGFNAGASVLINGSYAGVVSVANSTSLSFTTPSNSGGTYILYVINTDGGTGISVPGISYSGTPSWSNAAGSLATVYETANLSSQLTATGNQGDGSITYSLYSGTLPPGSSLNTSTGLLSGTTQSTASSTTYTFTIRATDGQNQDTDRAFSITINPDDVTWSSPTDNSTVTAYEYTAISPVTMSATSAAGKSITYTANTLPTGVTISGNTISGTPTTIANTNTLLTANAASTFKTATKNINFVVNQDVVTWSSPADGTITELSQDTAMSNVTLSATSAAGQSIAYTANALPTGVTISGSNVTGTPTVLGNTISVITATAANTNRTATRTFTWVVSVSGDPYFKNTILLLNGEGTSANNGSNNNIFIDSSNNNLTITRAGNATQGSFSPYSVTGWSNYFSGASLNVPTNAALNLGSGAYTIEGFFNTNSISGQQTIISFLTGFKLTVVTTPGLRVWGDAGSTYQTGTATINAGTWYHFAWVRESTTLGKLYLDGVLILTVTSSNIVSSTPTGQNVLIGTYGDGFSNGFNGYISNLRVLKGTALYTSAFTPPTTPLTAIANTSLLTCQSNRFIDNSTTNAALTINGGTPTVQAFSPFAPAVSYTPSLHGGSAYFDGTGDYINAGSGASVNMTGDFTVEMWIYGTNTSWTGGDAVGATCLVDTRDQSNTTENNRLVLYVNSTESYPNFYNAGTNTSTASSIPANVGVWNHIAYSRSGSTIKIFVNGVQGVSFTDSTSFTAARWVIGMYASQSGGTNNRGGFIGYISNHRIINGTALYTSTFVPPPAPITPITNTSLLLNFTNAGIIDQHGSNVIETLGGVQLSTAVKKYGSASMSFDGTGDYLSIPSSPNLNFGTGDFTIESWLYPTSISATASYIFDQRTADSQNVLLVYILPERTIEIYVNGGVVASGGTIALNSWSHFAITRASNSLKMFLNGTQIGSTYSLTNTLITAPMYIGTRYNGTQYFNGYMDDFRVTKGYARYTSNFTAPTAQLTTK